MSESEKTLVAILASHDSVQKNRDVAQVFKELYYYDDKGKRLKKGDRGKRLSQFHFILTGGTFTRVVLGKDTEGSGRPYPGRIKEAELRQFIMSHATVLPDRKEGGVTVLANLVAQRQCGIIWPFLSPTTTHWLHPENLALMRLCDLWNAKRLMNIESVRAWFRDEAERDVHRNPQPIPLKMALGTPEVDQDWPQADRPRSQKHYVLKPLPRKSHDEDFWTRFGEQTVALIAHDAMKVRMVDFAVEYETELCDFGRILATGTTGQEVESACRRLRDARKIRRCLTGPKGGDIEIATEVLFDRCHIVIFFVDRLVPHPHQEDIQVVFAACMAEIQNNEVRMLTNEVQARAWMDESVRPKRASGPGASGGV